MDTTIFACYADPLVDFNFLFILADSIRKWTKQVAQSKIIVAVDEKRIESISPLQNDLIKHYDIHIQKVILDIKYRSIPYNEKTQAAGQIEQSLVGQCNQLIWIDVDSAFINYSPELQLDKKALACRPVDLKLIGCEYNKELDSFWKDLYKLLGISYKEHYSVISSVDQIEIYSYFNAGMLVVNPHKNILALWERNFKQIALNNRWEYYYTQNPLYKIFLHQTILGVTINSLLSKDEISFLDYKINYSLRNHNKYSEEYRIKSLDKLISFRIDDYLITHDFSEFIISKPLKEWINSRIMANKT